MSIGPVPTGLVCPDSRAVPSSRRRFHSLALVALAAICLLLGSIPTWAQPANSGGKAGLLDKPKARLKLLEHYRAKLEVKDDAEWNLIQARIENVLRAERELQSVLTVVQHRNHSSGSPASNGNTRSGGPNDPGRVPEGSPEADVRALQKLVATRAPAQELKPRLARVRDLLRAKQEKLAAAREDLRVVLSSRQEAIALLSGLLR